MGLSSNVSVASRDPVASMSAKMTDFFIKTLLKIRKAGLPARRIGLLSLS